MSAIVFIKLMISVFLLNLLLVFGAKYVYFLFQKIPESGLLSYFRKMWLYGFLISLEMFGLTLIWFPTLFDEEFFSNPTPTLGFVLVASIIFATVGAVSASQPSRSVILIRKIQNEIKKLSDRK